MTIRFVLVLTFFNFVGMMAARVLLSLPIGAAADRYGPRWLLVIGAVCGAAAMLVPYFVRQVPAFYVAAALSGLSLAFNHVTLQNLMGVLSKPEDRARNFSNFSLVGAVVNFVGPLLAGFSIDHAGHAVACLYVAAPSLIPLVLLALRGNRMPGGSGHAHSGSTAMLASLREPGIWQTLGVSGLVQLGTDLFLFYLPIHGHAHGLSASAIGAVLASFASASFLVRFFLARLIARYSPEKLLAWSFCIGAAGFGLMPLVSHALALAAIAFVFGLGMGIGTPISVMLMFSRSPEGRSGQALGLRLTTNNLVRVSGPVVFGALASALGLTPVLLLIALLLSSGVLLARGAPHET